MNVNELVLSNIQERKMNWSNWTIGEMPRESAFRFRVSGLHYCRRLIMPQIGPVRRNNFEVSIRLESEAEWCEDTTNGELQKVRFPNVAWKRPGGEMITRSPLPRDTLAFHYSAEIMREFFRIGMEPAVNCRAFVMTPAIEHLVSELRKLICNLYTPGVPDRIDWTCFQLYKNLLLEQKPEPEQTATVIRNISMWIQTHYDEPIDMSQLAKNNSMSHTKFYAEWKKVFDISPTQYVIECKLEAAAQRLLLTGLAISKIVREVNFSGVYAFHKRFFKKYGMTPAEYRKKHADDPLFIAG
jgi:AraC-like DNA-binding protein